jgi:AraC-like DNA-binding protein
MVKIHQDHIDRINKVVRYIDREIATNMSLSELADLACFSPFHFQRIFKSMLGETPKQYIKRLRLEEAARIIAFYPELSILEVALRIGFQSLEAFSRAFKDYYSYSPDHYRKAGEIERIYISQVPYMRGADSVEPAFPMSSFALQPCFDPLRIEIVSKPAQHCVSLQTTLQSPQLIGDSFRIPDPVTINQ